MRSERSTSRIARAGLVGALAVPAVLGWTAGVAGAQAVDASGNNIPVGGNNQVPASVCNNHVPANVLGVQVPVQEVGAALGLDLINEGSDTPVNQDESCDPAGAQDNQVGDSGNVGDAGDGDAVNDRGGLARVGDNNVPVADGNQVPASVCNNQVPANVLGVQVPVQEVEAALGLDALSPDTNSPTEQDESCDPRMAQQSDVGDGEGGVEDGRSNAPESDGRE